MPYTILLTYFFLNTSNNIQLVDLSDVAIISGNSSLV